MANLKHIAATLAILGSGALVFTGCEKKGEATETPGGAGGDDAAAGGDAAGGGDAADAGGDAAGGDAAEAKCGEGHTEEGHCGADGEG
ncbi:MAG: hypothetical protein IPH07_36275 [Deltaproteobacteria bacterium]|nr:hypothetical protein [Deltaproteobacteria bacterium]MBK8235640.1 hypothetical protein [Deltaproteobacteria bacterium]MBK8713277.1 hypothetical protein [Deltaproteobacteria bacterium]MBP7288954.1 hypothetical protein [Nannocystaceae bacterium]